jgi:hypothetical protein
VTDPARKNKLSEGRWVMTSQITKDPWTLTFFIGAIPVAKVFYSGQSRIMLRMMHKSEGSFASISDAMKRMHQLLKLPPEEAS